jgi:membrane protein DedA with SNARE-associated domain
VVFVSPGWPIAALAGATRVPLWLFLPAATAGHAMWATLTYRVGEALSAWLAPILQFVQAHVASTTLASVVLVGGYALWRRRARRHALRELDAQVEREVARQEERSSFAPSTSDG